MTVSDLKLFVVLSRAYRSVMDVIKNDVAKHGLNTTEFAVLELLYNKGEQPLQQIGQRILLASGSITYVVDKLEQKGLLARRNCPNDRRVTFATLTETGMTFMNEIFPKHEEAIHAIFSTISDQEKETLYEVLKNVGYHADSITKK